jgi:large subunit ribosomal protein L14e
MMEIGRVCVKIAGRDAGKKGIIVDILDDNYALIDGQTRRKKCNFKHLEPLDKVVSIVKGADTKVVIDALKKEGIECVEKTSRPVKEKKPRPIKQKKVKPKKPKKEKIKKDVKVKTAKVDKKDSIPKKETDDKKVTKEETTEKPVTEKKE